MGSHWEPIWCLLKDELPADPPLAPPAAPTQGLTSEPERCATTSPSALLSMLPTNATPVITHLPTHYHLVYATHNSARHSALQLECNFWQRSSLFIDCLHLTHGCSNKLHSSRPIGRDLYFTALGNSTNLVSFHQFEVEEIWVYVHHAF